MNTVFAAKHEEKNDHNEDLIVKYTLKNKMGVDWIYLAENGNLLRTLVNVMINT
jgi:hypothetical protein